jgi:tagatose-1,6-bisphosphate aldolase non-catalytic subunit AgaZ/GatZ
MTGINNKPRLNQLIKKLIQLRSQGIEITLLAVCPNSDAVLEAAIKVAAQDEIPMLFAATLNQVDRDGGYTGWTQQQFVMRMKELAVKYGCTSPLYPCLDHGGPWLKDLHTIRGLSLQETMDEVKRTLGACLEAGYDLLHIDPTVDRTLPRGQLLDISDVVSRTVELIAHAEKQRRSLGIPPISYEVGTEEVHGGLADLDNFDRFLSGLKSGLQDEGILDAWPCFIVGKVGTDLHTTTFDPGVAQQLYQKVSPLGSLIKGHYTDWVENPHQYPTSGMGGANVGPEFTAVELKALYDLCDVEDDLVDQNSALAPSRFRTAVQSTVVASNRWRKWLFHDEEGLSFEQLDPLRQEWLVSTGARYIWTAPPVVQARQTLYQNLKVYQADPHAYVIDRIAGCIRKYVAAFNLRGFYPARAI